jgi:acetyl coenzyme A synthetase (ADP forming)-like protein
MSKSTRGASSVGTMLVDRRPLLKAMLNPKVVALLGAAEAPESIGHSVLKNLRSFGGIVYVVNGSRSSVLGLESFPSIQEVPERVDLAVIATPPATVPQIVKECAEAGVKGAVIVSAGFKECGAEGRNLEEALLAARGKTRLLGPNCFGVMVPELGLNATVSKNLALPGSVAFVSQSGALCASVLDWSLREKVGFSAFVSTGSMIDVDWGDLIYYLADDLGTRSILLYMESIGNARSFLSAAREVALRKPIIVMKVGRTEAGAKALAFHTGTVAGNDDVLEAAFRRVGILRCETIEELFEMAEVLGKQPRPKGCRLAVVTNAGGPAVLATDMLVKEGGEIALLSDQSYQKLNEIFPGSWSENNPVDVLGDASADRFVKAVEIVSADRNNDGILVIVTPQALTDPTAIAKGLEPLKKLPGKPILASWMGASAVAEGEAILNAAGIPTFQYPDTAVRAFCSMSRYNDNLCALYETPTLSVEGGCDDARAERIIDAARKQNRTLLSESESKQILHAYGIPTAGVTVEAMRPQDGYELMVGSRIDPQFGPVLRFGSGGGLGKVMKDYALGLPPLNATLARRMMEQTRVYTALKSAEDRPPGELASLEALLVRFSLLVARQRRIKEINVDPLLVSPTQMFAQDARILLHDSGVQEQDLPRLAIRPYPEQYVTSWRLRSGTKITIRPIRPEDEPAMVKFHSTLSEQSVHFRYFGLLTVEQRTAHGRLARICFNDYEQEIAIVAVRRCLESSEEEIIAIARLIKVHGANEAEFALVVCDECQGEGLGTHLLKLLLGIGRQEGIDVIFGHILPENYGMQRVCKNLDFTVSYDRFEEVMKAEITL